MAHSCQRRQRELKARQIKLVLVLVLISGILAALTKYWVKYYTLVVPHYRLFHPLWHECTNCKKCLQFSEKSTTFSVPKVEYWSVMSSNFLFFPSFFCFCILSFYGHISVKYDEKPSHTKFGMNQFMMACDMAAWIHIPLKTVKCKLAWFQTVWKKVFVTSPLYKAL